MEYRQEVGLSVSGSIGKKGPNGKVQAPLSRTKSFTNSTSVTKTINDTTGYEVPAKSHGRLDPRLSAGICIGWNIHAVWGPNGNPWEFIGAPTRIAVQADDYASPIGMYTMTYTYGREGQVICDWSVR
ncbi:hypothetical protein [Nocardiopsis dassonvillei]|uniref:hypothetical protein n=1 Tax=Nocardiopsis dassonvillei TaxID=2014 RepID=UPI00363583F6